MYGAPPMVLFSATRPPGIPPGVLLVGNAPGTVACPSVGASSHDREKRGYLIASGLMGALALPEVGSDAAVKRNS